jgi:glycosyltransferase involved in cell wall biosynthesis
MVKSLQQQGVTAEVATVFEVGSESPSVAAEYPVHQFPLQQGFTRYSRALGHWLRKHVREYDLLHIHAVFNYPTLAAASAASRARVPFIVRPLGILNRWGMEGRNALGKKLWYQLLEKRWLNRAAAFHFTSQEEADDVARLRLKPRPVVLPLGLDLSAFKQMPARALLREKLKWGEDECCILFLSRLHTKKGLDLLFQAFAQLRTKYAKLVLLIAGDGDADYTARLVKHVDELGLSSAVHWLGFVNAESKLEALAAADVFCLPSYSENFGVALLEGMAAGLPCVASDQVALANPAANAGVVRRVQCTVESVALGLEEMLTSRARAVQLGQKAQAFAFEHYDITQLGQKLRRLYDEVLLSVTSSK